MVKKKNPQHLDCSTLVIWQLRKWWLTVRNLPRSHKAKKPYRIEIRALGFLTAKSVFLPWYRAWHEIHGKNLNRHFSKDTYMTTEHRKRCSTSRNHWKFQFNHNEVPLSPTRKATPKTQTERSVGEDVKSLGALYAAGGKVKWCILCEKKNDNSSEIKQSHHVIWQMCFWVYTWRKAEQGLQHRFACPRARQNDSQ